MLVSELPPGALRRAALLGEVGLDAPSVPYGASCLRLWRLNRQGFTRVMVPLRQAGDAQLVEGIEVFGIASITQLMNRHDFRAALIRAAPAV